MMTEGLFFVWHLEHTLVLGIHSCRCTLYSVRSAIVQRDVFKC